MPEKIRIGIIHRKNLVIADSRACNWDISSFSLATDILSFWDILDSAFATPSRYIQEIFLRLFELDGSEETSAKFIFNPLFDVTNLDIAQILAALKQQGGCQSVSVFTDEDGLPVGYLFAHGVKREDSYFLNLLSAVDGELDAELCRRLFLCDVTCYSIRRLSVKRVQHNGFAYEEHKEIYRWTAERAISVLDPVEYGVRGDTFLGKYSIPFTAFMPHHAGDALFFSLAWRATETHVKCLAVNRLYSAIVADMAPGLALAFIDQPPANRGDKVKQGNVVRDSDYFHTVKDALPHNGFYYYCRLSRDYNRTKFHLVDHFAFALGRQSYSKRSLLSQQRQFIQPVSNAGMRPLRVLLHFDAGWPLKIYPHNAQETLIDLLCAKGYEITVLAGESYEHKKCNVTTFNNYESFKKLVNSHHVLVGMDSFPVHYATHVLDIPTICLFSSTRPENSNSPAALNYTCLEKGLYCRPCHGFASCPLYGENDCRNFSDPEIVADEVVKLLNRLKKKDGSQPMPVLSDELYGSNLHERKAKLSKIYLRHIKLRVTLFSIFLPVFSYLSLLHREYAACVRSDGFVQANVRALRYMRRLFGV